MDIVRIKVLLTIANQKKRRFAEEQIVLQQKNKNLICGRELLADHRRSSIGYVITLTTLLVCSAQPKTPGQILRGELRMRSKTHDPYPTGI